MAISITKIEADQNAVMPERYAVRVDKEGFRRLLRFAIAPNRKYSWKKRLGARAVSFAVRKAIDFPVEFEIGYESNSPAELEKIKPLIAMLRSKLAAEAEISMSNEEIVGMAIQMLCSDQSKSLAGNLVEANVFDSDTKQLIASGEFTQHKMEETATRILTDFLS